MSIVASLEEVVFKGHNVPIHDGAAWTGISFLVRNVNTADRTNGNSA